MYIIDGIAYAGEQIKPITVSGIRPLADHQLWIRFSTGEVKLFDFTPLLDSPAFQPLREPEIWNGVYIDYGVPIWKDGEIDIAPEYLYENGVLLNDCVSA